MSNSTLKRLLAAKVHAAFLARDCTQKLDELTGQAHVWLYITAAREFHIVVWRSKVFPSESEWYTFLRCLPREVLPPGPLPHYTQIAPRGRKCLKAHWRLNTPTPFGDAPTESDDHEKIERTHPPTQ